MRFIVLFLAFVIWACELPKNQAATNKEKEESLAQEAPKPSVSIEEAEQKVIDLPLIKKLGDEIEKISNGKKGVSFITNEVTIENTPFFELYVGYNSAIRFENRYILYVNRTNIEDIRILEASSGKIVPLSSLKEEKYSSEEEMYCTNLLVKIVKSSNLDNPLYKADKENCFLRIDRKDNENIYIEIYVENDISDNAQQPQVVERSIAWLLFNTSTQRLYDITLDIETPKELTYDKELLKNINLDNLCKE